MLENPTENIEGWSEEAQKWIALNREINANPDFFPLTIKGAYVIGIIHTICETVSILLKHPSVKSTTYLPAYGVFASAIELLGRCITGNATTLKNTNDLETGFKWLASSFFEQYKDSYLSVPPSIVLVQTNQYKYAISNLVALRHFSAHGQATSREITKGYYEFGYIDFEILEHFPPLIAVGLERYWSKLRNDEGLCNRLASANIIALRKSPVFRSWSLFEKDPSGVYYSIEEIFNRFDWTVSDQ
jgi:hypothetical protein